MDDELPAVVLFGDVVRSRERSRAAVAWLESLCRLLDALYGSERLAAFEFTQGDELQGLLRPAADPFRAVLEAALRPHDGPDGVPAMRWAVVHGQVDRGRGPATRRTGDAFVLARQTIEQADHQDDGLLCRTGDAWSDALLERTAPVLSGMIGAMTDRQRLIARLALIDGLRQADVADRLGIARPTVSVAWARADVRSVGRLAEAVRSIWVEGVRRAGVAERTDGARHERATAGTPG